MNQLWYLAAGAVICLATAYYFGRKAKRLAQEKAPKALVWVDSETGEISPMETETMRMARLSGVYAMMALAGMFVLLAKMAIILATTRS